MSASVPTTIQSAKSLPPERVPFSGVFILRRKAEKTAKNGNPYLSVELGDRTGSFNSTVFSDTAAFEVLNAAVEGAILRVDAVSDSYQGRFAPRLNNAGVRDPAGLTAAELDALVEVAPEDADAMWAELLECIAAIPHEGIRATVSAVFDEIGETFRVSPAAISMHHAYRAGLLEHTLHMARDARALLPLYPQIDPSLALAGVILHDSGKVLEYSQGLATRVTRLGNLQGHLVIGYQLVRKHGLKTKLAPSLLERLEHILLSHHGTREFGAATLPATPEAIFVSLVDNLDAKMGMVQRLLRNASGSDEFSERIVGLENAPLLLTPPETGHTAPGLAGSGNTAGDAAAAPKPAASRSSDPLTSKLPL
ncbi:MAG: HD domain-containing protein [Puniceicoccales bacterium]|jgi:3'-5' exoribonuclease|nr:HD domain-containing protein [Puniceicoccales bacterium]